MLNAILNNKTNGIVRSSSGFADDEDFPGHEDSLTATVFERLSYLSDGGLSALLRRIEVMPRISTALPLIENIEFWPRLAHPSGQAVVPDVLLEFASAYIIIESKRWDYVKQQKDEQLKLEAEAAVHKHGNHKPFYLWAVGGWTINNNKSYPIRVKYNNSSVNVTVIPLLWHSIGNACEALSKVAVFSPSDRRIFKDIVEGLMLHGINCYAPEFFKDIHCCAQGLWIDPASLQDFCMKVPGGATPVTMQPIKLIEINSNAYDYFLCQPLKKRRS
jgi:hypothetical protein